MRIKSKPVRLSKDEKWQKRLSIYQMRTTKKVDSVRLRTAFTDITNTSPFLSPTRLKEKKGEVYTPGGKRMLKESTIGGVAELIPAESPVRLDKPQTYRQIHMALSDPSFQFPFAQVATEGSDRATSRKRQVVRHLRGNFYALDKIDKSLQDGRKRTAAKQVFGNESANMIVAEHDVALTDYEFNHLISDFHLSLIAACVVDKIVQHLVENGGYVTPELIQTCISHYCLNEAAFSPEDLPKRYKKLIKFFDLLENYDDLSTEARDGLIQRTTNVLSTDAANLYVDSKAHNTGTIPVENLVAMLVDPELAPAPYRPFLFEDKPNLILEVDVDVLCDEETSIGIKHNYVLKLYLEGDLGHEPDLTIEFDLLPLIVDRPARDLTDTVFEIYQDACNEYKLAGGPYVHRLPSLEETIRAANLENCHKQLFFAADPNTGSNPSEMDISLEELDKTDALLGPPPFLNIK